MDLSDIPSEFKLPFMTYLIALALHIGGFVLSLISITPARPPKRWTPGQPHEVRLDGRHKVHWEPMD